MSSQGTGNKTAPFYTGGYDASDFWVVRLDAHGSMLWDKSFGGSEDDCLHSLKQTSDGGFILGGHSRSSPGTGNKTSARYGGDDFWVVRLDADGNIVWDKSFGGSGFEYLYSLQQTADGGFVLGGYSDSSPDTGNKSSPFYGGNLETVASLQGFLLRFGSPNDDNLRSRTDSGDYRHAQARTVPSGFYRRHHPC